MSSSDDDYHFLFSECSEGAPFHFHHSPSSPTARSFHGQDSSRTKKHSSLTTNTLRQFFTPRSVVKAPQGLSSRKALGDITRRAENMATSSSQGAFGQLPPLASSSTHPLEDENSEAEVGTQKRRKIAHSADGGIDTSATSPNPPSAHDDEAVEDRPDSPPNMSLAQYDEETEEGSENESESEYEDDDPHASPVESVRARDVGEHDNSTDSLVSETLTEPLDGPSSGRAALDRLLWHRPVRRWHDVHNSGRLLHRELGLGYTHPVGAHGPIKTERYYSKRWDVHKTRSDADGRPTVLPFCVAPCNGKPRVAVGDETGRVRILREAVVRGDAFRRAAHVFRPHYNAILDMVFSNDDAALVTASGDQTARIIDMVTETEDCRLMGHSCSLKTVRFQPRHNSILATSSRDGNVKIWDLRCSPSRRATSSDDEGIVPPARYRHPVLDISGAHTDRVHRANTLGPGRSTLAQQQLDASTDNGPRRDDVSVTALEFMPLGREHLFVTASEANACVKLWDMRASRRRGNAIPLSTTRQPLSHERFRPFGTNSLAVSPDSGRLYSLCRDNTVYVYSTSHLILGHAPALERNVGMADRPVGATDQEGLGPIYGFRHNQLRVATFYVKLSLRKARGNEPELLACGSSNNCVVLMPTESGRARPGLFSRQFSTRGGPEGRVGTRVVRDDIPLYRNHGTALSRGHRAEVTDLKFTVQGNLVTVADDGRARFWRPNSSLPGRHGRNIRRLRRADSEDRTMFDYGWAVPASVDTEHDSEEDDGDGEEVESGGAESGESSSEEEEE